VNPKTLAIVGELNWFTAGQEDFWAWDILVFEHLFEL